VIVAIGLFLNQNFKKQISILKNNYLEINNHILQWYTGTGKCTSINLKRVTKIERDKYRGFDRFIIFEGKNSESIINLLEPEEFQAEIEKYTKLKVEYFDFELRKQIIKGAGFFIPAILGFVFSYLNYLDIRFSFLVLRICNTVKGKGIDFIENNPFWHHKSKISDEEINQLCEKLA
jgi:hypothetical protein